MAFHDVRFPAALSYGSLGGPERLTEIVTLRNGYEERNTPWRDARRRYDAGVGLTSLDDLSALIEFFEARGGQMHAFRWKDWVDFKSGAPTADPSPFDQLIGIGDDVGREFQLVKAYGEDQFAYARTITKPVAGTIQIAIGADPMVEGIDFTCDVDTGLVTMIDPVPEGAEVTAGYEFDVPVRFDTAILQTSLAAFGAGEVPSVPVVEVRL